MTENHALRGDRSTATAVSGAHGEAATEKRDFSSLDVDRYVDGYRPISLAAPHSSLLKTSTWVGMGLILASLAGIGSMVFAAAGGAPTMNSTVMTVAIIITVVLVVSGFGLVFYGRRDWKKFSKATGYKH
ncbi:MAG: hypothetical protein SPK00_02825 [Corynebacterium glucuronolyticum]|nr:hypothetical protein [Corynebacterium glucuronolyticum]MDD7586463.1 hypothetical protein [Mycobacteriaceae bacterium]MDY5833673.1 hypothetical protein [Corynebacterium glucuronolyticum]